MEKIKSPSVTPDLTGDPMTSRCILIACTECLPTGFFILNATLKMTIFQRAYVIIAWDVHDRIEKKTAMRANEHITCNWIIPTDFLLRSLFFVHRFQPHRGNRYQIARLASFGSRLPPRLSTMVCSCCNIGESQEGFA